CIRNGCACMKFVVDWDFAFGASPAKEPAFTPDRMDSSKMDPRQRYIHVVMGCASVMEIIRDFPLDSLLMEMVEAEQVLKQTQPEIWQQRGRIMMTNRKLVEAAHEFKEKTKGFNLP
ncbi:MAG: hypothetical protein V3W22_04840, partial [Thermoplasmata archaeon]